jgi:hypothetical protein
MRQQQAARFTVGDTTTIVHRVSVPQGALVQPRGPADTTIATLLGLPRVSREGDSVRIAYTVTLWAPGPQTVVLPGAIVARLDGRIDTLPDARVAVQVGSLLPTDRPAAQVAPRQARPWVPRADRTFLPWGVAAILLTLLALVGWWHWRRRGPQPPRVAPPAAPGTDLALLRRWVALGETRLAVQHLEPLLAAHPQAAAWQEQVAEVRFAPTDEERLRALADEGLTLLERGAA